MNLYSDNNHSNARVLGSTIAGSWYPGTASGLDCMLAKCFSPITAAVKEPLRDLLVLPHAGYSYSAQTAAYAVKHVLGAKYSRVVLLAPSHRAFIMEGLVAPESAAVSTPYGQIPIDTAAIKTVARAINVTLSDGIHANEHSAQIQYPILQYALGDFKIAPFIVGSPDYSGILRTAAAIKPIMDDKTLLVISSDFTHYGDDFDYTPFRDEIREKVRKMDFEAFKKIQAKDLDGFLDLVHSTGATICGRVPIAVMMAMLPDSAELEMTHYKTSSDDSGDFSRFVCYMSIAGRAGWGGPDQAGNSSFLTSNEKLLLLKFARNSIKHTLDTGKILPDDHFKGEASRNMRREMGCFVTLKMKNNGDLRGCIGEIEAHRPLFRAVTAMAVHSAFGDTRFHQLHKDEFDKIEIEISALTPARPVKSWRDIVIGKHGVIVTKRGRSAVFLPQVAPEQGWTLEETLTHLCLKAGLRPDDWREGAEFTVFEAIVFGESDVNPPA